MFGLYECSRTKKSGGRTSTNLYLQYKWDIINYENHRYNVRTAQSRVDNEAPRTFAHLYYRPKKIQLELERFCHIQRNNKYLLDRLATIQREGAWIDNKNFYELKSLNTWKRQQEMIELAYNNQAMLHRLLDCHSQYNHHKLENEYLISQKHRANVQKFSKDWRKIKYQMKCMRKHLKARVIAMRTGKLKSRSEDPKAVQRAIAIEALKLEKAADKTKLTNEVEEKERIAKSQRLQTVRERRRAMSEWEKASKEWRIARDERLQLIKERKIEEELRLSEARKLEVEKQKKRRDKIKKKLEKWRKWKAENEKATKKKVMKKTPVIDYLPPFYVFKKEEDSTAQTEKSDFEDLSSTSTTDSDSTLSSSEDRYSENESEIISSTEAVYFEGGRKKERLNKDILHDLRADKLSEGKLGKDKAEVAKHVKISSTDKEGTKKEKGEVDDFKAGTSRLVGEQPSITEGEASEEKIVTLEGGQKQVTVGKDVLEDLRADISQLEAREERMKNEEESGGEKEEEIEEEIIEDLQEDVSGKDTDISDDEDGTIVKDLSEAEYPGNKQLDTTITEGEASEEAIVVLEGGKKQVTVDEEILEDLRTDATSEETKESTKTEYSGSKQQAKNSYTPSTNEDPSIIEGEASEEAIVVLEGGNKQVTIDEDILIDLKGDDSTETETTRSTLVSPSESEDEESLTFDTIEDKDFEVKTDFPKINSDDVNTTQKLNIKSIPKNDSLGSSSDSKSGNIVKGPTEVDGEELEVGNANIKKSIPGIKKSSLEDDKKKK